MTLTCSLYDQLFLKLITILTSERIMTSAVVEKFSAGTCGHSLGWLRHLRLTTLFAHLSCVIMCLSFTTACCLDSHRLLMHWTIKDTRTH